MNRPPKTNLYINVLSMDNLIAAIDRAEEQLFDGIEYAMSTNIQSADRSVAGTPSKSLEGRADVVPATTGAPKTGAPKKRPSAYAASLAASSGTTGTKGSGKKTDPRLKRNEQQPMGVRGKDESVVYLGRGRKVDKRSKAEDPDDMGHVVDLVGDQEVLDISGSGSAPKKSEWNPKLNPAKGALSKRQKRSPAPLPSNTSAGTGLPNSSVSNEIAENSQGNSGAIHGSVPTDALGQLTSNFSTSGKSRETPVQAQTLVGEKDVGKAPAGTLAVGMESQSALRADRSSLPASTPSSSKAKAVPGTTAAPSDAPSSSPSGRVQSTLVGAPGVMFVPGLEAIGTTAPNGYRMTADGLRPVVTVDQRPKAPHQLRQKIVDKIFDAVKSSGASEMDAIVKALLTEQRLYANAAGKIEYKSACMAEIARLRKDSDSVAAETTLSDSVG